MSESAVESAISEPPPSAPPTDPFGAALHAAKYAPENDDLWEDIEEKAREADRPDEVAAAYRFALKRATDPSLISRLGQRAVRFHDEWYEDAAPLAEVLLRVVDVDSSALWAHDRLVMLFTVASRWDDLLALYDRALAAETEKLRRTQLLDEAAHVAKDFAAQPDRAIAYLQQLLVLKPTDAQLATSLERLFERQKRHRDLVELWTSRLPVLPRDGKLAMRARIASAWLEKLDDPAQALAAVEALIPDDPHDTYVCKLLEKIVAAKATTPADRRNSIGILKERYTAKKRGADVVRVLQIALDTPDVDEKRAALDELATRLVELGQPENAIEHVAALLLLDPTAPDAPATRARMLDLADRSGRHDRYADAMTAAAAASSDSAARLSLLVEAARVRADVLADEPTAIDLYAQALALGGDADVTLGVARRLEQLLAHQGRAVEQLDVLDKLAVLESDPVEKRAAAGRAAHLATQLGQHDRALVAWARRLEADPRDLEALDATVQILEQTANWEALLTALRRRFDARTDDDGRRGDLARIARVSAERLGLADRAIAGWREIEETFGPDAESVDALAELLAAGGRFAELVTHLSAAEAREKDPLHHAALLFRLGEVHRSHLAEPSRAVGRYAEALALDPSHEGARAGLLALLDDRVEDPSDVSAAEALARAFHATGEWQKILEILEHRLAHAPDDAARTAILLEAAALEEQRAGDPAAALTSVCRAFPLAPSDARIEAELLRLASLTDGWTQVVDAYRRAIPQAAADGARVAALRMRQGSIQEEHLGDPNAALTSFSPVHEAFADDVDAAIAVVRVAAKIGLWEVVARALVSSARARMILEPALVRAVETSAEASLAWDAATSSLAGAIAATLSELQPRLARELETQVALWHRDRRSDPDAAELALGRAVSHDQSDAATLQMLAVLQRRAPGKALLDTLLKLADASTGDLGVLYEAAVTALDDLGELAQGSQILERLLKNAGDRWRAQQALPTLPPTSGPKAEGGRAPTAESLSTWALDRLVGIELEGRHFERAIDLLVEYSKLPFTTERSRSLRHRAAGIAATDLGDPARAIALYRALLDEDGGDREAIAHLGALYRGAKRSQELVELLRHELSLEDDVDRRLAIRLELAQVLGDVGDRDARLTTLRDNLDERAGDPQSIAALTELLEGEADHATLAKLLTEQALRLEARDEASPAARLWARVADLAEHQLHDTDRALTSLRRVVALEVTLDALDALARLHGSRGEHAVAIEWLEDRLARTPEGERASTVVHLGEAFLAMGDRDRALRTLETALQETPAAADVRELLGRIHREAGEWPALAALLEEGTRHAADDGVRLGFLREAAEIRQRRLDDAAGAIPLLEEATRISPKDRGVRAALAEALRVAGRLDEARTLLDQIIEEYGRRRPPERAQVHVQLAQVAEAKGDLPDALAQLELASSMDMGHVRTLRMLGTVARRANDLTRAERAYRALLIVVRRPAAAAEAGLGPAEVLFELYRIATDLQQPDRARETLESAFDAAAQSEEDATRLTAVLRTHGEDELLLRALKTRLQTVQDPATVAEVLGEISAISERLGRVDDAMEAVTRALEQMPTSSPLHEAARALAERAGRIASYADLLEDLAERVQAAGEVGAAADLFLRLGGVRETEGRLVDATAAYEQAEATGERVPAALRALDHLHASLGERHKLERVLRARVQHDEDEPAEKTDALYRLADLQLADPATADEGADMLAWAIDRDPQLVRAAAMLARDPEPSPKVAALFERVARASGDEALLLDALERRAAHPDATQDILREAVELAGRVDESRAEKLLQRAVVVSQATEGGAADGVWALSGLAERAKTRGLQLAAVEYLRKAAQAAEGSGEGVALALEAAALAAGPANSPRLAAELYEELRARDPGDRNVWQPLLTIYRTLGERSRVDALIAETVESVSDATERNVLRVERARLLLGEEGRREDAIAALREILDEDAEHKEATDLLSEVLEKDGRRDELADLLSRQLDAARGRDDAAAIVSLSLRLGALLGETRREEAMDVYRAATGTVDHRDVLRALVALFVETDDANDRADVMERLLVLEEGPEAGTLSLTLVAIRRSLEDEEGATRALEIGFRAAPQHAEVRTQLERLYDERAEYEKLAAMIAHDGMSRADKKAGVARLREAAKIQSERLQNAGAAATTLERARELAPEDVPLLCDYARLCEAAGDPGRGIEAIGAFLDAHKTSSVVRVMLLQLRAELHGKRGDAAAAVEDLEAAYALAGRTVAGDLALALDARRHAAAHARDREGERHATMRLVEILTAMSDPRASEVLGQWIDREPTDMQALRLLAGIQVKATDWIGATDTYGRIVEQERGEAQIEAALELAKTAQSAGTPEAARPGLERAFYANPESVQLRLALREIYTASGALAELARLALTEAEHAESDDLRFERSLEAGDLLLQAGDLAAAIPPLELAVRLRPAHHDATLLLADAYTVSGNVDEAMSLLVPAIDRHKGKRSREVAALMHRMARAANAGGGHDVELAWLQKALDADMQNGQVASELAEVAMELRQWDIALKALKAVTLLKTPGPMSKAMANLRQGMIAHQQGDARRAVVLAKTALAQDPKLSEAAEFLKRIGGG